MICEFRLLVFLPSFVEVWGCGNGDGMLTWMERYQVSTQVHSIHRCHRAHYGYKRQRRQAVTELDGGTLPRQAYQLGAYRN